MHTYLQTTALPYTKMNQYHVVEILYKNAGYQISSFETEKLLREYIVSTIFESKEYKDDAEDEEDQEKFDAISITEFIELAISYGRRVLKERSGYAIISVFYGKML